MLLASQRGDGPYVVRDIFLRDYILWYSRAPGRTPARILTPAVPRICRGGAPGTPWYPHDVSAGEGFSTAWLPAFARVARPQFPAKIYRKTPLIYRILSEFIEIYGNSRRENRRDSRPSAHTP